MSYFVCINSLIEVGNSSYFNGGSCYKYDDIEINNIKMKVVVTSTMILISITLSFLVVYIYIVNVWKSLYLASYSK